MKKLLSFFITLFMGSVMLAQTAITGTISDANGQPIPGANIVVSGKSIGTTTDFDGNFSLKVNQTPPFSIEASLIGFATVTAKITQINENVAITLGESATILDEVVVSASRTPERILESPVTIERMDIREIKNTTSPSFYDGIENLKGVDVNTNSLTFKSVNTRGFATFANTRFMQLVDGMDNSSPALNFNLGNLLGMSELDVNSVELLPGASSALYGANAFNGVLFMTSKNPFDHDGISFYAKSGMTTQEAAGDNQFVDFGIRMAYKFSEKFAAKASFSFLKGTDWFATDYRDFTNPDFDRTNPAYDGLNIYGDEVATTLNFDALAGLPEGTLGSQKVSRTGYQESDLTDYVAQSAKADIALHYRPTGGELELIYNFKFGVGNTIYQGANRYALKDFFMQQQKLEIRNNNFFVRAYMTGEDGGNSYDTRFAAINTNRSWKSDTDWFTEYAQTYIGGRLGLIPGMPALDDATAHQVARGVAQTGALVPGTAEFKKALNEVIAIPDLTTGAKFQDNTKLYNVDVNYNFHELIDFVDIQVGSQWRMYSINSKGSIFTDYDGPINYDEWGAYMQLQKKFINERLKFTGSIRYDKAQNFDGNFSPRVSFTYSAGENKNHNIRASFQTGFRNPTTQDQYVGIDAGSLIIVGSAPDNLERYTSNPLPVSAIGQSLGAPSTVQLTGTDAYYNAFSISSISAGSPEKAYFDLVKPEKVTAYEVGYRGRFNRIALDVNAYYNDYKDFIGNKNVVVPLYGQTDFSDYNPETMPAPPASIALSQGDYQVFQIFTNSPADISSYGGSIGVSSKVFADYSFGISYTFSKFDFDQSTDPDYEAGFNTPEHKVKVSFGNPKIIKNVGFNINYRWNDEYLWQSTFADGIIAARSVFDAQVNYTVSKIKSVFKIGGANIGGKEYFSAPGTGKIGSQYYMSWTINP
ncbi:TonB-dependent receptor [Lutibacter holmesii]|uniref:TonB-dependent receptor n=1 Tax=Lutibacter holmesii TaxID=1137985 RepID=A0ABW3WM10_9FLAO